jgi:hypothetical protein
MREPCPGAVSFKGAVSFEPPLNYSPTRGPDEQGQNELGAQMKRPGTSGLQRAYLFWTLAGVSLIAASAAGSSVISLLGGTADAGSAVWGIVGVAALLGALVLFALGLRLRHRYVNTVQSYESRGAYVEDGGSHRPNVPLVGDGQARPNLTNPGP